MNHTTTIAKHLTADESPWGHEALIFSVSGARAVLTQRVVRYHDPYDDHSYATELLLHGEPLSIIHHRGCPTCHKLIESGYRGSERTPEWAESVKRAQSVEHTITESLELLQPLIGLLADGHYVLSRLKMPPYRDDIPKQSFWTPNDYYAKHAYEGMGQGYYEEPLSQLLPSQSLEVLSKEALQPYLAQRTPLTGLTYHLVGREGLLLDGHHRALSAYIKHEVTDQLILGKLYVRSDWARAFGTDLHQVLSEEELLKLSWRDEELASQVKFPVRYDYSAQIKPLLKLMDLQSHLHEWITTPDHLTPKRGEERGEERDGVDLDEQEPLEVDRGVEFYVRLLRKGTFPQEYAEPYLKAIYRSFRDNPDTGYDNLLEAFELTVHQDVDMKSCLAMLFTYPIDLIMDALERYESVIRHHVHTNDVLDALEARLMLEGQMLPESFLLNS